MSTIIATTLSNGSVSVPTATVVNGSAKAWCNWGQSGTQTINDSFNIASITDYNIGGTSLNFSNSFSNGNYAIPTSLQRAGVSGDFVNTGFDNTVNHADVEFFSGGANADSIKLTASIHGDLA